MFKNKHVVVALIVAPILSVLAWIAVGNLTAEKPAPAQQGASYPLVEKSNCRYESGFCDLENEDFELRLSYLEQAGSRQLVLSSSHALDGVVLGIGAANGDNPPGMMRPVDGQGFEWRIGLDSRPDPAERIRLVASARGSSWFADASTTFLQPAEGVPGQR